MSKKSSEEQKEKKRRGFLGYLWLFFLVFLLLLAMATGFFYWKTPLVTSWFLELYAKRLAVVMTSSEYYQINAAQKANESKPGEFLENERKNILTSFMAFVKAYETSPNKEWYPAFIELHKQIQQIFEDNKVLPAELEGFVGEIQRKIESVK